MPEQRRLNVNRAPIRLHGGGPGDRGHHTLTSEAILGGRFCPHLLVGSCMLRQAFLAASLMRVPDLMMRVVAVCHSRLPCTEPMAQPLLVSY
jgi:hypothetical protein